MAARKRRVFVTREQEQARVVERVLARTDELFLDLKRDAKREARQAGRPWASLPAEVECCLEQRAFCQAMVEMMDERYARPS